MLARRELQPQQVLDADRGAHRRAVAGIPADRGDPPGRPAPRVGPEPKFVTPQGVTAYAAESARAWLRAPMTGRGPRLRPAGLGRLGSKSASAGSPSRSTRVPTVTGHGPHFDARGGEELTDLGGVLNDVQRHAADNHSVQRAVVSMGGRKWPSGHLLGEAVKGLAYAAAAPVDVPEKLGLSEHSVGEGVGVVVKRLWRCPRLELASQVIVERI